VSNLSRFSVSSLILGPERFPAKRFFLKAFSDIVKMRMDLKELKSLAAVARCGSITKAGELLHLTPSAIHRHLKLLSEELNVALYERRGLGLRLTPVAANLLPLVEDLLIQCDSIQAAARDWNRLERGVVRIGAGPTFSSYVLPPFMDAFRKKHPAIDLYLEAGHTGTLLGELADGLLDLVFLVPRPSAEVEFVTEAAWEFDVPLIAPPGSSLPKRVALRSLSGRPFLLYRQGTYFEELIDRWLNAHHFVPRVAMRLDNAEPIKALVRSGFGVSLVPDWTIRQEVERGDLVRIPLREAPLRCRLALLRRRAKYVPAPTAAFVQAARQWRW
jgi:DNA-binding transcriptional LysR family regulator